MTASTLNAASTVPAGTMHPVSPTLAESLPLRDIHLPEPISWWPLAPGWWILLASLIFIISIYFIVKKVRYSRRLKRASRGEFEVIKNQYLNNKNDHQLVKQLSIFLRRACISFYPRQNTAGLTGESWLNFLDRTLADANKQSSPITDLNTGFNSEAGKALLSAPYLPEDSTETHIDTNALLDLCERWLKAQPVKNHLKKFATESFTTPVATSNHSLATSGHKQ